MGGWESFSPWLERVEAMDAQAVWRIAEEVPPEWYGGNVSEMEALVEKLLSRRSRVRELVVQFRESERRPMPKWVEGGKGDGWAVENVEKGVKM